MIVVESSGFTGLSYAGAGPHRHSFAASSGNVTTAYVINCAKQKKVIVEQLYIIVKQGFISYPPLDGSPGSGTLYAAVARKVTPFALILAAAVGGHIMLIAFPEATTAVGSDRRVARASVVNAVEELPVAHCPDLLAPMAVHADAELGSHSQSIGLLGDDYPGLSNWHTLSYSNTTTNKALAAHAGALNALGTICMENAGLWDKDRADRALALITEDIKVVYTYRRAETK